MACLAVALLALCASLVASLWSPAHAVDAIIVKPEQEKIDITALGELYEGRGDRLQLETAPGRDGYVGRMAVQATTAGTNPGWLVFALTNPTNERITRWLVAPRYTLANSRVASPDARRPPHRRHHAVARLQARAHEERPRRHVPLEPRAWADRDLRRETAHRRQVPRLTLWDLKLYQAKQQDRMLFNGVLLGITGLLAIFLTAIFAANHRAIFPATALVAWAVLAYFCVDFGYWSKLFPVDAEHVAVYRAAAEAGVAASLVLFLYCFLRIGLWHGWIKTSFWCWIAAQFALVVLAIIDPRLASGLARGSMVGIAAIGTCLIAFLALRGQDRALLVIPSWMLLLVWLFGAAMIVLGKLSGDVVVTGLPAGLVLILVLLRLDRHPIRLPLDRRPASARAGEPGADQISCRRRLRRRGLAMERGQGPHHHRPRGRGGARNATRHARYHRRPFPPAHARRRPRALPSDAVVGSRKIREAICKPSSASSVRTGPIFGTSFARGRQRATMRACSAASG